MENIIEKNTDNKHLVEFGLINSSYYTANMNAGFTIPNGVCFVSIAALLNYSVLGPKNGGFNMKFYESLITLKRAAS